ncbi:hypothetical protein Poly24_06910 [Rosistilla carotiformis]|uniref:Uncharacterized protein n=1 Tax=Rosistilla carotiformis TaxID=2528017 RepID=A0A518JN72_9BACT|nr:hypothetical protein Poly24_06910 [Rosistilla carotiformis]
MIWERCSFPLSGLGFDDAAGRLPLPRQYASDWRDSATVQPAFFQASGYNKLSPLQTYLGRRLFNRVGNAPRVNSDLSVKRGPMGTRLNEVARIAKLTEFDADRTIG